MDEQTDEEIILLYKNGNLEIFKEILNRYSKSIFNFSARIVNKNNATDITQEVFIKVWKNLKRFDSTKANFKTWIFTITKNTTTDFLRKKKSILFTDLARQDLTDENENSFEENIPDENLLPEEALQKLEDRDFLNKTLEKLNAISQEILILHYQEEMTFEEISKILNKSINTVKSQHRRAIIELRKMFD